MIMVDNPLVTEIKDVLLALEHQHKRIYKTYLHNQVRKTYTYMHVHASTPQSFAALSYSVHAYIYL